MATKMEWDNYRGEQVVVFTSYLGPDEYYINVQWDMEVAPRKKGRLFFTADRCTSHKQAFYIGFNMAKKVIDRKLSEKLLSVQ